MWIQSVCTVFSMTQHSIRITEYRTSNVIWQFFSSRYVERGGVLLSFYEVFSLEKRTNSSDL